MTRPLRSDAIRNRDKLLAAAAQEFGAQGLDAPLEHIAKRAGVSIGTLYNHFPTRDDFFNALLPERIGPAMDQIAARALADDDPWRGFETYLDGIFALQAKDRALRDAISQRITLTPEVLAVCQRGLEHAVRVIDRAKAAGRLRPDFEPADLTPLVLAVSEVIQRDPDGWRRFLAFHLDGLRA
ncbi:TetR/AcrR family transcriptional regulator [Kutzneria sp. CA-103260]|uniref:TetR/AcrR family transcriptional regulator n=1 Tax=Kutzneria sp. CA-103260 TaxID=2802641 RepID=UPI001BA541C1|nr:TetR/AcrR family transcriptional regulator [Kutzneria sp. CA-103260]QUQ69364.1 TetR family transcriptional regulator [Kutzneria sp. CA-103260]